METGTSCYDRERKEYFYIPKTKHEALNEYYRANEPASHKKIRRALARLILREVRREEEIKARA